MKKTAAIISFITVLTVLFSSCGRKDYGADGLAFRLLNLYDSLPPCSQFIKNGEEYSPGYISPEDFLFSLHRKTRKAAGMGPDRQLPADNLRLHRIL